jgi:hypothetical protein
MTFTLPGDSEEYEILTEAARHAPPGLICEIGCRLGGGVSAICDGLTPGRTILSVDPYGDMPYHIAEDRFVYLDYGGDMLTEALCTIPVFCRERGVRWLPLVLEDAEFFKRFRDGVPIYERGYKRLVNEYALVHVDGPHCLANVIAAIAFFSPRLAEGGWMVFDDWQSYDHPLAVMLNLKFEERLRGERKIAFSRGGK